MTQEPEREETIGAIEDREDFEEYEQYEDEPGDLLEEIQDWAQAIVRGAGDTLRDMLRAGRRASQAAADDYWDRFDRKTRHRREQK